jgi:V8-like Glu-specific endopeptidase
LRITSSFLISIITVIVSLQSVASTAAKPKVIYGDDNRKDIVDVQDSRVTLAAESTVALILKDYLKPEDQNQSRIANLTFKDTQFVCADEPFANQVAVASCSGFLVDSDTIITAGHCISNFDCSDYAIVFGYTIDGQKSDPTLVNNSDIYFCQSIIKRVYTSNEDFSIVKLDRPVQGRSPLRLSSQAPQIGEDISVIGHPSGLPTKYADNAKVRSIENGYFVSSLDTYGGNSGSAVFNSSSFEVIGILVRGEQDYIYDRSNNCYRSNVCAEDSCNGEDATSISAALPYLQK